MPLSITYDQWMKSTHSKIKPRSDSLKRIDQAIQFRDQGETRRALIAWIDEQNTKRQDWQRSVRNEKGAVKKLYDELGILGTPVSANVADAAAKDEIRKAQRRAASLMFVGREIKFRDSFWGICRQKARAEATKLERAKIMTGNIGKSTLGVGLNIGSTGSSLYGISANLKTAIQSIMGTLPEATQNQLVEQVFGTTVDNFVTSVTPFLGMITSGAKAAQDWVGVARNIYAATEMEARYGDVRAGDPAAALQAMVNVIDRQIKKQTADAVIRTSAFAAKGATAAADLGTATNAVIGAVESIALLLNMLADLVMDAKQMVDGNRLILQGKIDLELFNTCPILGCYFIVVQDHSTIMNFDIDNMGRANWKQEAERLRYAIGPVLEKASDLIDASRIGISGMDTAKGVYQSSIFQKFKLKYKEMGFGQSNKMESYSSSFDIFEEFTKGQI